MNLLRREGASVFFRSYGTTLLMNIPFTAVNFGVYDTCKSAMFGHSDLLPPVGVHVVSGAIAGGCAAAATTPLDVVKVGTALVLCRAARQGVIALCGDCTWWRKSRQQFVRVKCNML